MGKLLALKARALGNKHEMAVIIPIKHDEQGFFVQVIPLPDHEDKSVPVLAEGWISRAEVASLVVINPCFTYEMLGITFNLQTYNEMLCMGIDSLLDKLNSRQHRSIALNEVNVFDCPSPDCIAIATWNVHHLGDDDIAKIDACINLFQWNPWLDVLVLQEVREKGVALLKSAANSKSLKMLPGPSLKSRSGNSNVGQGEYYPIIYRTERISECIYWRSVKTDGTIIEQADITWSKTDTTCGYRPTVVYQLTMKNRPDDIFRIGVVHTTPGAADDAETRGQKKASNDEFQREDQYLQVKRLFEKISTNDPSVIDGNGKNTYWIIGGDYYLGEEAMVSDPSLSLGRNRQPYDKVASHSAFKDDEGEKLETLLKQALRARKLDYSNDPNELVHAILELKSAPGEQRRGPGLVEYIKKKPNDKTRFIRMLNLKRLVAQVRWQAKGDGGVNLVTNSGATVVRHELDLSFIKRIPTGLKIMAPVSGTNWDYNTNRKNSQTLSAGAPDDNYQKARWHAIARTADIFVVSTNFHLAGPDSRNISVVGMLCPGGGLLLSDTESLTCSKYWHQRSDHFPIACYLAIQPSSTEKIKRALVPLGQPVIDVKDCALTLDFARDDLLDWELWTLIRTAYEAKNHKSVWDWIKIEKFDNYLEYIVGPAKILLPPLEGEDFPEWFVRRKLWISNEEMSEAIAAIRVKLGPALTELPFTLGDFSTSDLSPLQ